MARAVVAVLSAGLTGGVAPASTALASTGVHGIPRGAAARPAAIPATDWPAYLDGPLHNSYSPAETVITPGTVPNLQLEWRDPMGGGLLASPTVADRSVYIGSKGGWFYRLDEHTGQVLARVYIGRRLAKTCPALGVVSTATYGINPANGQGTLYVAGPDGYLYALRAYNLSREWRSVIALPSGKTSDYFDWSSPTVANGKVYIGVSSECDKPLVRGGVIDYKQATGKKIAEFYTVPKGRTGGSVWSSIGVGTGGDVFATTGNGPADHPRLGFSESIIKLSPAALKLRDRFQVPAAQVTSDGDFGASPVIVGNYVGACNKNGIFYLLNQSTMKVVWEQRIGVAAGHGGGSCLATPASNGTDLFFGGNMTTAGLNGIPAAYNGSVQERVATTGALVWETGLAAIVRGSPTLDGGGVLAAGLAGSQTPNGVELLDAATGLIMEQLVPGVVFAQPVFADNSLFCATDSGLSAWGLPSPS